MSRPNLLALVIDSEIPLFGAMKLFQGPLDVSEHRGNFVLTGAGEVEFVHVWHSNDGTLFSRLSHEDLLVPQQVLANGFVLLVVVSCAGHFFLSLGEVVSLAFAEGMRLPAEQRRLDVVEFLV